MIGRFGYNVPFPQDLPALVVVLVVGAASFTALGLGVSTLIPNQEAGAPVTSIVFFVLLFLSGLWFPLATNSGLAKFSSYLPVRHMIVAVYDASIAQKGVSSWPWHDLLVMAIWGVGAVLVAARGAGAGLPARLGVARAGLFKFRHDEPAPIRVRRSALLQNGSIHLHDPFAHAT